MSAFTDLEKAIFIRYREIYGEHGFPILENILFKKRITSSVGRLLLVGQNGKLDFESGNFNAGDHCYIQTDHMKDGLFFELEVKKYRIFCLHIHSNGGVAWNGDETGWEIL